MTDIPEEGQQRRTFFKIGMATIGGLMGLAMAIPLVGFAISPVFRKVSKKWVDLGIVDLLKGSRYKKINYTFIAQDGWVETAKRRSVYVTDEGDGNFVVYSRVCSHLGCLVRWDEGKDQFFCPCHGAVFDSTGNVVAGPPPRPMEKLPVRVQDGILYVKES